jgi:hypothetical protein
MSIHAFLITANGKWDDLRNLLSQVDDYENDIYLHISANCLDFNPSLLAPSVKKSHIFFLPRHKTWWGSPVFADIIFDFLNLATKKEYSYYHWLTAQDLMLVSNKTMHEFFEKNAGKEFIWFSAVTNKDVYRRYSLYHPFLKLAFGNFWQKSLYHVLVHPWLHLQEFFRVDKIKKYFPNKEMFWGSGFFSIDNDFAHYVCSKQAWFHKAFVKSVYPDECFLQTLVMTSSFRERLYKDKTGQRSNARLIVWDLPEKGSPHPRVFSINEYQKIMNSGCIFARKFSLSFDSLVVEKVIGEAKKR